MRFRLSLLCGLLFAAAALGSGAAILVLTPLQRMAAIRDRLTTCGLPGLRCAPPGTFLNQRAIGAAPDAVFGPSDPDTLVSSAWVNVGGGAIRLAIPATGDRFYAIQIRNARDSLLALATPRTFGTAGGTLVLTRDDKTRLPPAIRVDTDWVWIVGRFAVGGDRDVPAVNALQNDLRLFRDDARQ